MGKKGEEIFLIVEEMVLQDHQGGSGAVEQPRPHPHTEVLHLVIKSLSTLYSGVYKV